MLDVATRRRETLSRDDPGPRAVLNALERLTNGRDYECRSHRAEIGVKRGQLEGYEARPGRPFDHTEYMTRLADLRDRLRDGLSEKAQREPKPEGPSVAELAERIKALREANTVEAAPERVMRKVARTERPVTARIRERIGEQRAVAEAEPEVVETKPEPAPASEPPATSPAAVIPMSEPARNGHAKAVARRRQERVEQLRLS